jgi:hypothetical protein
VALNFDFENIRTTEFGVGRDDEDTRVFHLMSVDAGVQTALQEMAKSSWESMQAINQNPDKYEPAEKYAAHEYLYIGLNEDLAKSMKELYEASNLPVDMGSLSDPKKVFCYFARMTDSQGRRLTAVRRAAQFKGALKARLIQLTTDSLRLIEDHVFKLDSDFDLLIDSVNVSILRPSGFEYTAQLEEAILQSVPKNLEAVQRELGFVNFTNIQEFAGKHPRAARYLASIRSQKEMKNINQKLLQKTCRVTGVQFKVVDGKIVVPEWHVMGFLEVLDRRRYEVNLVKGSPEQYKAASRKKLEQ